MLRQPLFWSVVLSFACYENTRVFAGVIFIPAVAWTFYSWLAGLIFPGIRRRAQDRELLRRCSKEQQERIALERLKQSEETRRLETVAQLIVLGKRKPAPRTKEAQAQYEADELFSSIQLQRFVIDNLPIDEEMKKRLRAKLDESIMKFIEGNFDA
ncbi:MAG: hypothetical protein QM775_31120 [Pirellulales bacterium]